MAIEGSPIAFAMEDARPLWMKLATLRRDACISAHYSISVIQFMRDWLREIEGASAAEGYPLTLINVAIDQLEDESAIGLDALESDDWMPTLPPREHYPYQIDDRWVGSDPYDP